MASKPTVVDITNVPTLRDIAEEVRRSGEPHVLRDGDDDVAVILPLRRGANKKRRSPTAEDRAAFRASAGGWKDIVDIDALQAVIRESRDRSVRPTPEL